VHTNKDATDRSRLRAEFSEAVAALDERMKGEGYAYAYAMGSLVQHVSDKDLRAVLASVNEYKR
jgi:hypothetical protein